MCSVLCRGNRILNFFLFFFLMAKQEKPNLANSEPGNLRPGERLQAVIPHLRGSRSLSLSGFQGICLTL